MEAIFGLTWFPAPARWNTAGTFKELPFKQMQVELTKPELWPGGPTVEYGAERLAGWSFARFRQNSRFVPEGQVLAQRVEGVYGLALSYVDDPRANLEQLVRWWGETAFIAFTQPWHDREYGGRPAGPRWMVVVPFSRPVDVATARSLAVWARHPRRHAGVIADETEDVCRWFIAPAINPGGFGRLAHPGESLDPDVALLALQNWREQDRDERARLALEGTNMEELDSALESRIRDPRAHTASAWPWAELQTLTGPLWPGRVVRLVGAAGEERSALLMQLALHAAASGVPVLLVVPGASRAEVAARLVALRDGVAAAELLAEGARSRAPLSEDFSRLQVWLPGADEREAQPLLEKVLATSEGNGLLAPLVLVDGVEGWGAQSASVLANLEALTDAGALSAEWPGAAVVFAQEDAAECLTSAETLKRDWAQARLTLGEADLLLALAADPASGPREVFLAALRNRDGGRGGVSMRYDPSLGGLTVL